ncbi:unnamed protein product [Miscanthus lutarioriparius]|uniref:Uncharacterized protein n=1 Tax=Miscanthus lutarioriparius TaxID=422564 RepID=A0A811N1S8_9POAL|nr:unnamed protein product [Miscanthus lutarioriparius]
MVGPELTVGGWFATTVISNFVAKVRSILEDNHTLHAESIEMLYRVKEALPQIQILVEVTERRAISNSSYATWLQQFKDVVSEAEDLLDDFETKRIREVLKKKKVSSVVYFPLRFVTKYLSDTDLLRLKDVLMKLNKIISHIGGPDFHGMMALADKEGVTIRTTLPLPPTQPVVIGRDKEKRQLQNMIFPTVQQPQDCVQSSKQFSVIAVIGPAGVGKTTLAQVIYSNPNAKEDFALRGWVMASRRNHNKQDIAKDIVDSFGMEQQDSLQTGPSESALSSTIENKRFFLVLDDVQDNLRELWGSLSSTLKGAANGSVVLLTTRSKEDANIFRTTAQVSLDHLPFQIMCRVFEHHAFGKQKKASLESIGKKIVQNLHGLPLLAEAIGRLLRQKLDEGHWQKISENPWWLFSEDDDSENVALPSVAIMCEYLTDHLRKCLGYCSIFPSGYLFEKNMLVHMWIASFMQQHDGICVEDMEKEWFDKLFNHSFFQSTIWKNKYTIPGMIKEPLQVIAGKECHAATDSGEPKRRLQLHRHLVIDISDFHEHLDLGEANKVRTVLFFNGRRTIRSHEAFANILAHPGSLRVLDFSYSEAKLRKFPDFLKAQTVSLVYKIGKLTNLQGLEEFPVGKTEGHKITELKNLNEISRKLCISNLEEVTHIDKRDAVLSKKVYLKKLVLKWGLATGTSTIASYGCMETLNSLEPNANLEELEIQCYMGVGLPAWMADRERFTKLKHIHLVECKQLRTLPPLGQLPSLLILVLQGLSVVEKIGSEFYGKSYRVFPSLEELKFLDMPNWREWSDIEEMQDSWNLQFPHLRKVQIRNCKVLSGMPLCCLQASLEELDISGCDEMLACRPSCSEELKCFLCLKVHHCLGRIYLPCDCLGSLEVLNLQSCKVYFQGGRGQIIKLRRILTSDCTELKAEGKEQLVLEVSISKGIS